MQDKAQKIISELLTLCGLEVTATIDEQEDENGKFLKVNISSDDNSGLLIGAHGSTLAAIQYFLAIALKQQTGEWTRVSVNVGDWEEKQMESLKTLATQTADRAKTSGQEQRLYNLTPDKRRIVHLLLKDDKEVETVSEGEGEDRYLVVKPKLS